MKKIFTLLAVAFMAMSASAQQAISFAGLTQSDITLGETSVWTWSDNKGVTCLDYTGDNSAMQYVTIKGIQFGTKRNAAEKFYRLMENGLYANGTNVNIIISGLKKGQEVTVNARSSKNAGGAAVNFSSDGTADASNPAEGTVEEFADFKFVASAAELTIKNSGAGFILSSITIGVAPATTEVEEIEKTTTWTLSGMDDGTILTTENVVNYQNSGLFLRSNNAGGSHAVKAVSVENAEGKFSTGNAWTATMALQCPGGGLGESGTKDKAANAAAAGGNDRCVAFKAAVDGTVYVAITTTSYKTDRELHIWSSDGVKVASLPSNDASIVTVNAGAGEGGTDTYTYHWAELKADVEAGKSYFIGGSNQVRIACIQFVKKGDTVTAIESIKANSRTNGRWYTLGGQQVAKPVRGLYIKDGRKVMVK